MRLEKTHNCAQPDLGYRKSCVSLCAFGILMLLVGKISGGGLAALLGFSIGGIMPLAMVGSSTSYIAVPAAMKTALPEANHGVAIAASLTMMFSFTVLVSIPLFLAISQWLAMN
ncbi:MAG: sodium-dependent bicarbonate transport family permease [Halioglobus sp.]